MTPALDHIHSDGLFSAFKHLFDCDSRLHYNTLFFLLSLGDE